MLNVLRFLFGSGWELPWHLLLYVMLLYRPVLSGRELWEYVRKGPGPEGLGVFLVLLLEATYVAFFSLVGSTLYVAHQPYGLGRKAGIVLAGTIGLPLLVMAGGAALGDGKVWGFAAFYLSVAVALGVNLWWLYARP